MPRPVRGVPRMAPIGAEMTISMHAALRSRRNALSYPARAMLALLVMASAGAARAADDALGVNLFGFSRHLNAGSDHGLREFNPGAGLQWRFARSPRATLDGNVGVYQDSFGHANWHLSLGARVRLLGPLSVGAQMINAVSPSLNDGYPVLTPYPLATVALPRADLHLTYIPDLGGINGLETVATFVTLHPWKAGAGPSRTAGEASQQWQALEFTVQGLHGLGGAGFYWRHMLDDQHGLRLGAELDGMIRKYRRGTTGYPTSGEYSGTLLLQYLHRARPRGGMRPYWTAGLENRFYANDRWSDLDLALRGDVGVEYEVARGLSLALETGLALHFLREWWEWDDEDSRRVSLEPTAARILLVARRDGDGPGAGARHLAGRALLLATGGNLTVRPLQDGAIAWRSLDGTGRGWRFVVAPDINTYSEHDHQENYNLEVHAERMHHRGPADGLGDYWGFGPLVAYRYHRERGEDSWDDGWSYMSRSLSVGLGAVVGAEFPVAAGLSVFAECAASVRWNRETWERDEFTTRWTIASDNARLGLAMGMGGDPGPGR